MTTAPAAPLHPFVERLRDDLRLPPEDVETLAQLDVQTPLQAVSALRTFPKVPLHYGRDAFLEQVERRAEGWSGSVQHLPTPTMPRGAGRTEGPPLAGFSLDEVQTNEPTKSYVGGALPPASDDPPPLSGSATGQPPGPSRLARLPDRAILLPLQPGHVGEARDQGDRGTCVAFALTACLELRGPLRLMGWMDWWLHTLRQLGRHRSEQFAFWAAKKHDNQPASDGTTLHAAYEGLKAYGVCLANRWHYDPHPRPGNPSHEGPDAPTSVARRCAWRRSGTHRLDHFCNTFGPPGDGSRARKLYDALRSGRPVAVTLAVFQDEDHKAVSNWTNELAYEFGVVNDPPFAPGMATKAPLGHAVCVVGFQPAAYERWGGYFLFRNSWGTHWARHAPRPPYFVPRRGHGQVSAKYVDHFLWEMCCL